MHFSKIFPLSSPALIEGAGNAHKSEGTRKEGETFLEPGKQRGKCKCSEKKKYSKRGKMDSWFVCIF